MIRTVIKLAIVAVVVHAAVRIVPVYWNYFKFKDAVQETANFSSKRTEEEVRTRVHAITQRLDLPISLQDIRVRKSGETTFVETQYTEQLEYFPGQKYPVEFKISVEGVPPRYATTLP